MAVLLCLVVHLPKPYIGGCRNAQGFQQGDFPWRLSFCAWSLAPPGPETLIVEDALLDARCGACPKPVR